MNYTQTSLPDCSMLPDKPIRQKFTGKNGRLETAPRRSFFVGLMEAVKFTLVSPHIALAISLPIAICVGLLVRSTAGLLCILVFAVAVYLYVRHRKLQAKAAFSKFMKVNRAEFGGMLTKDVKLPCVYGVGRNRGRDNAIKLLQRGVHIGLFQYRFTHGYGWRQRTETYTIMHIQLGTKEMPHIVLDSRANDKAVLSSLPTIFDDDQRVSLPGNFDKYFDLYAPDLYKIDALSIVTPDFMSMLIDNHLPYDLEINGRDVYLIYKGNALSRTELQAMFKAMDTLIEMLKHKVKTWHFAVDPNNPAELRQNKGEQAIHVMGRRISGIALVVPYVAILGYMAITRGEIQPAVFMLVLIGSIAISIAFEVRRYERRRERSLWHK